MYSLSSLRNWSMQFYSATLSCSIMTSLAPNNLSTPKGYKFYNKIHIKWHFVKLQRHFFQDLFLIGCNIFLQVMVICLHLIKHVPLGFNTFVAPSVCILRAKLWKVVINVKLLCFNFRSIFLKIYIFEVVTFYLILQWSNQGNFGSGSLNL